MRLYCGGRPGPEFVNSLLQFQIVLQSLFVVLFEPLPVSVVLVLHRRESILQFFNLHPIFLTNPHSFLSVAAFLLKFQPVAVLHLLRRLFIGQLLPQSLQVHLELPVLPLQLLVLLL